ncbi:DUF4235 domain-containing protein [Luteolibacter flavescens]|uniref:DUF4235 domain-containing protein n=1 Tax=Luteolibacter flavescens TaxID=1859460 RepID=A0ABT3FS75_9BACT|nr:DUF4235 domain-containing protein [Luteolibacter flavescens]MCW1886054.1 DUF4235 domain-containing protein [Luteolibacter flavescens]
MKPRSTKHLALKIAALALPALADRLTRRLAARGFTGVTGQQPPRNPAVPFVTWKEAILWTAIAGAMGGVARMASRKALAGKLPVET